MIDIHRLMRSLAKSRPIFHSEADFQFALAWRIQQAMQDCEIRLEFKPILDGNMFLDVWIHTMGVAIELKYPKRNLDTLHLGERFVLRDGAPDLSRYDFLMDVQRLEQVVSYYEPTKRGFAVLLTNDPGCWNLPLRNDTNDAEFRIHDGRKVHGEMRWKAGAKPGRERQASIWLSGTYDIRWEDYSTLPGERYGQFKYLAVEVG